MCPVRNCDRLLSRSLEGRSPRGGAVLAPMWAREGPPSLLIRGRASPATPGLGALGAGSQGWTWGQPNQKSQVWQCSAEAAVVGLSCSPIHPVPHTCPREGCGVAPFWKTRRRTGRILTPAGEVDTTSRRRVVRLNLLYSDFFSDFSPITIIMHASFRKCGKKKRMKTVHNSTTILACFLLEEQCSEQLFTR